MPALHSAWAYRWSCCVLSSSGAGAGVYPASLASAWLARLQGSTESLFQALVQMGYSQAPVALMALMIGLATELFTPFMRLGMTSAQVNDVKAAMILLGWVWSIWLAWRILQGLGVGRGRWLALLSSVAGSCAMAAGAALRYLSRTIIRSSAIIDACGDFSTNRLVSDP